MQLQCLTNLSLLRKSLIMTVPDASECFMYLIGVRLLRNIEVSDIFQLFLKTARNIRGSFNK